MALTSVALCPSCVVCVCAEFCLLLLQICHLDFPAWHQTWFAALPLSGDCCSAGELYSSHPPCSACPLWVCARGRVDPACAVILLAGCPSWISCTALPPLLCDSQILQRAMARVPGAVCSLSASLVLSAPKLIPASSAHFGFHHGDF